MATPAAAAATLSPAMISYVDSLPAATAPPGVVSDFVHPPSDLSSAIATIVICTTIATTVVVIRVWTKGVIMRQMFVEDYVIILGWLLFIGEEVPASIALGYGNGADEWNVSVKEFSYTLYTNNLTMILYCLGTMMIKISVLLQYLRIFVPTPAFSKVTYIAIWATIGGTAIYYVTMTGFLIGLCNPREKIWNIFITSGSCFDVYKLVEISGILNVATDVVIFLLPLGCLWRLQMRLQKRLAITAVFGIGILAIIASIVRCYYSFLIASTNDETYITSILGIWAAAECTIGIVIACAPVFPRFYDNVRGKVRPRLPSKDSNSSGSSGQSNRLNPLRRVRTPGSRSTGSRKMGIADQWGESLFEPEKVEAITTRTYPCAEDDIYTAEAGIHSMPEPAMLSAKGTDLERGEGRGGSRSEIWKTTSIDVSEEPVSVEKE